MSVTAPRHVAVAEFAWMGACAGMTMVRQSISLPSGSDVISAGAKIHADAPVDGGDGLGPLGPLSSDGSARARRCGPVPNAAGD